MKHRETLVLGLALLSLAAGSYAGELVQTVTFKQQDLSFSRVDGYDRVNLAGVPAINAVGAPRLPCLVQALVIPAGAVVTGVDIISTDERVLDGSYAIIPSQKAVPLPMPGKIFKPEAPKPDPAIYGRNAVYPEVMVKGLTTGSLGGYRIGHAAISPLRYNPVTKKLYLSERITYRVLFQESQVKATIPTKDQQGIFGQQAKMLVANPGDVDLFAPQISLTASKVLPAGDYRSLIISGSAAFDSVFARLAYWHTKKGYRDTVVNVSSIYSVYPGYDDAEKIRNFIIDARNIWGTVFVLLAGQGDDLNAGQNLIPARHAYYTTFTTGGFPDDSQIPSDWYYSDLDGTWDANGNHIYGELGDDVNLYSDVFVGRAPVLNVAQAQNFVAKTLTYEKNNPGGYVTTMLLPAAILWEEYEERPTQRAIAAMTPAGWSIDTLFERNEALSDGAMVAIMDFGAGLGHWLSHGNENGVYYVPGAYYSSADADAANNGDNQGVHISSACLTGAMDEVPGGDCLAEHIINRAGGGAVGVMMNSRYGWGDPPDMGTSERIDTTFFNRIFFGDIYHQGQALTAAKNAWVPEAIAEGGDGVMRWCLYELNCFGDPALPILTGDPVALTVNHPASALIGYTDYTVSVSDEVKTPVQGALVCLMTESKDSYVYDTTDASGSVTLQMYTITAGQMMHVTVTARDHQPYEGLVPVIAPAAYIAHLKHTISDAAGNNDGVANPGETVQLPTWVKNYGISQAANVTAILRTLSPNGTVTADSNYSFGTIVAGDSAYYGPGFGLLVNPADTNGTAIPLTLECRDGNDSVWTSSFSLTVGTAALAFESKAGRFYPNEATKLTVNLKNNGLGYSYNTQAVLRCGNLLVTITDSTAGYGTINPGAVGTGSDSFTVAVGAVPAGTVIELTLVMKATGTSDRMYNWNETVGDLRYQPTPDNTAGTPWYYAVEDSDGVGRAPVYQWAEIRPIGTQLTLNDDGIASVTLPFTFNWYGTDYTALSVGSNGWISFGPNSNPGYDNLAIPAAAFAAPTVFPLWNDLDATSRWVGYYNDAANHRFIVEYDSIVYYSTLLFNKFQVIYCDSTVPDPYHDVVMQYNLFTDGKGEISPVYPSVGFQQNGTVGSQLLYNHSYASTAMPLASRRAVRITRHLEPLGVAGPPEVTPVMPQTYHLGLAYPNPARSAVTIAYQLPKAELAELAVYNIAGQKVKTLAKGVMMSGKHTVRWDGRDESGQRVSAGIYLYRLTTPGCSRIGKLSIVK